MAQFLKVTHAENCERGACSSNTHSHGSQRISRLFGREFCEHTHTHSQSLTLFHQKWPFSASIKKLDWVFGVKCVSGGRHSQKSKTSALRREFGAGNSTEIRSNLFIFGGANGLQR